MTRRTRLCDYCLGAYYEDEEYIYRDKSNWWYACPHCKKEHRRGWSAQRTKGFRQYQGIPNNKKPRSVFAGCGAVACMRCWLRDDDYECANIRRPGISLKHPCEV